MCKVRNRLVETSLCRSTCSSKAGVKVQLGFWRRTIYAADIRSSFGLSAFGQHGTWNMELGTGNLGERKFSPTCSLFAAVIAVAAVFGVVVVTVVGVAVAAPVRVAAVCGDTVVVGVAAKLHLGAGCRASQQT